MKLQTRELSGREFARFIGNPLFIAKTVQEGGEVPLPSQIDRGHYALTLAKHPILHGEDARALQLWREDWINHQGQLAILECVSYLNGMTINGKTPSFHLESPSNSMTIRLMWLRWELCLEPKSHEDGGECWVVYEHQRVKDEDEGLELGVSSRERARLSTLAEALAAAVSFHVADTILDTAILRMRQKARMEHYAELQRGEASASVLSADVAAKEI